MPNKERERGRAEDGNKNDAIPNRLFVRSANCKVTQIQCARREAKCAKAAKEAQAEAASAAAEATVAAAAAARRYASHVTAKC